MTTFVDGARDDLMPVSRNIGLHATTRNSVVGSVASFIVYDVEYRVMVPGMTKVASPWLERFRP